MLASFFRSIKVAKVFVAPLRFFHFAEQSKDRDHDRITAVLQQHALSFIQGDKR